MHEIMKYKIIIIVGLIVLLFSCEREMSPEQADKFIKFYGNYLMDEARDIEVLDDGGYAICGIDSLPDLGKRMVLVVTDQYGNVKEGFPQYYTEEGLESGANAIVPIRGGQGGYLLCGFVERPVLGTVNDQEPQIQRDIFLVKASNSGLENWQRSYGSSVDDEVILHAVERISSGYMLAGYQVKDNKSDILIMGIYEEGDSIPLGLNYNNPYAENGKASFLLKTDDRYLCVCTYDKIGVDGTDILVLNFDDELSPLDENLTDDSDEYGMCIVEEEPDQYLVLGNRINVSGKTEIVIHLIEDQWFVDHIVNISYNHCRKQYGSDCKPVCKNSRWKVCNCWYPAIERNPGYFSTVSHIRLHGFGTYYLWRYRFPDRC